MKKELDVELGAHPFLRGMPERHLKKLAGCARHAHFKAGAFIIREGKPAEHFYLLTGGRVALEIHAPTGGAIALQTLEAGEVLGWSWLVEPYRWRFDGRAVEEVAAVALDAAGLREQCAKDHELAYELLKRFVGVVSGRLEATRMQLLDLYGTSRA